jgi:hypothetical protein
LLAYEFSLASSLQKNVCFFQTAGVNSNILLQPTGDSNSRSAGQEASAGSTMSLLFVEFVIFSHIVLLKKRVPT